jgi:hypothetical protein
VERGDDDGAAKIVSKIQDEGDDFDDDDFDFSDFEDDLDDIAAGGGKKALDEDDFDEDDEDFDEDDEDFDD